MIPESQLILARQITRKNGDVISIRIHCTPEDRYFFKVTSAYGDYDAEVKYMLHIGKHLGSWLEGRGIAIKEKRMELIRDHEN